MATNHIDFDGTNGQGATFADYAELDITGDIDVRVRVAMDTLDVGGSSHCFLDRASNNVRFELTAGSALKLFWHDGTSLLSRVSTVDPKDIPLTNGVIYWFRGTLDVDNGAAGHDVKFYYAVDADSGSQSWTQVGTTVTTAVATSIRTRTDGGVIGTTNSGANGMAGKLYNVEMLDGIDGTPVLDVDFTDLTVPEVAAKSFDSDANTATITLDSDPATTGWRYSGLTAVTGTAVAGGVLESEIVTGGETIILTTTGDTWVATAGDDNAITDAIIAGIDSAQSEGAGWDAEVKGNMVFGDVARTSDTVITVTLAVEAAYVITANETITVTVPATAYTTAVEVVATPTFDVTNETPSSGGHSRTATIGQVLQTG